MSTPLQPMSANAQNTPQRETQDPMSPSGSEYSIMEYAAGLMQTPNAAFASFEKHPRSTTSSPQKSLKKARLSQEGLTPRAAAAAAPPASPFNNHNMLSVESDEMEIGNDTGLSGFSDITLLHHGIGVCRRAEEEVGEVTVDLCTKQLQREQQRERRKSIATSRPSSRPTTPGRDRTDIFDTPPSSRTQHSSTPTPRPGRTPARLAALSQYTKSTESTPEQTMNLIDFTQQFNDVKSYTPSRHHRRSQSVAPRNPHAEEGSSPSKRPLPAATPRERRFLLDFDIPPPPTPRSIPSVTPRELEDIKSHFFSQIAQLKAELSGKDAVINGLKSSVSDAERRCANGIVELRQVREDNEDLSARSVMLEAKLQEVGRVMADIKDEIIEGTKQLDICREEAQTAKEDAARLRSELHESNEKYKSSLVEYKRELQQANSATSNSNSGTISPTSSVDVEAAVKKAVDEVNATKDADINAAVERVAKELHTLYKSKHENKVNALKQSYAGRWEKRVKELEQRNAELSANNNEMSAQMRQLEEEKEEHLTGPVVSTSDFEQQKKELNKLKVDSEKSRREIKTLKEDLEAERREKGELVLACDELLAMGGAPSVSDTGMANLKGSISRASGIGIAKGLSPVKHESGLRPPSSLRGGIEKMGGGAGLGASSKFGLVSVVEVSF